MAAQSQRFSALAFSIIQHLRFPFSFFLLPVFVFALAHQPQVSDGWFGIFFILHFMIYPASNGYNSLQDKDQGSIGGIEFPSVVPQQMGVVTAGLDSVGLIATFWFYGWIAAVLLLSYIAVSRLYSYRGIRLKRYPIIGFLSVVIFQGGAVFLLIIAALGNAEWQSLTVWLGALVSTLLIGASYPLTQVYQHQQDRNDGVTTISFLLGVRGTFVFTALIFSLFIAVFWLYGWLHFHTMLGLFLAVLVTTPAAIYLVLWARKVWRDESQANFKNAMRMTVIGSVSMNLLFALWFILIHFNKI